MLARGKGREREAEREKARGAVKIDEASIAASRRFCGFYSIGCVRMAVQRDTEIQHCAVASTIEMTELTRMRRI